MLTRVTSFFIHPFISHQHKQYLGTVRQYSYKCLYMCKPSFYVYWSATVVSLSYNILHGRIKYLCARNKIHIVFLYCFKWLCNYLAPSTCKLTQIFGFAERKNTTYKWINACTTPEMYCTRVVLYSKAIRLLNTLSGSSYKYKTIENIYT